MTLQARVHLPVSLGLTGPGQARPGQASRTGTGQRPRLIGPQFSKAPLGALRVGAGAGQASGTELEGTLTGSAGTWRNLNGRGHRMGKARAWGSGGMRRTEGPALGRGALRCAEEESRLLSHQGRCPKPLANFSEAGPPAEGAQGAQSRELAGWSGDTGAPGRRRVSVARPTVGRAPGGWGTVQRPWLQAMEGS